MADIIERLRYPTSSIPGLREVADKAADEITRLRAEVERLTGESMGNREDADFWKERAQYHLAERDAVRAELAGIKEMIAGSVVGVPVRFKDGELCLEVPQNYRHYTKRVHLLLADSDSVSGRV